MTAEPLIRESVSFFFEELKTYMGFDDECEALLRDCLPVVEPHFPAIVESFYDALQANERTRALLARNSEERLRRTLHEWIRECFEGPWDTAYFERRQLIGQVHVRVGLLPHFMSGAMNVVRRHLLRILLNAEVPRPNIKAVERVLDLDLAMMHQSYWDFLMEQKLTMPVALTTGLAHEIRNPLNAITLNLKLLERRLQALNASDSIPIVEAVRGEVRRISGLTSEIMDFAKPVVLNCVWHRTSDFLDAVRNVYAVPFEAAGVALTVEASGEQDCYCDLDRMHQVVVNLLGNAADAVEPGGTVALKIDVAERVTTITVSDTGMGMDPKSVHQIFDLFYTQKSNGTGLGLPIVKNIVEAHGGRIEVDTKLDEGTTFTIRMPRPRRA